MLARRRWIIALVLGCSTVLATVAEAQLKLPFKRRTSTTADENQSLALTQANGPWLIMCASFTGEFGAQQARQLASELRSKGLDAYLYRHTFDHSGAVKGSGWAAPENEVGDPVEKNWRSVSAEAHDEIAVVVGNYASLDDHTAQTRLKQIRAYQPRSLMERENENQPLEQRFRAEQRFGGGGRPLGAAFMMPNPMLPPEYFQARNIDNVVVKLNKGKRYSLLDCPGAYSVRVATFTGKRTMNADARQIEQARSEFAERVRSGKEFSESETAAALYKANVLCRALRKMGVEAYEFHDRYESYVCIGSFDWATHRLDNGKDQLNPEIAELILKYKGENKIVYGQTKLVPRTLAIFRGHDINFDMQPMPIVVPKLQAKTARRRGLFGR